MNIPRISFQITFLMGILGPLLGTTGEASKAKRTGPLGALPSKPEAHIEKIKVLGDEAWLDLGQPKDDPKWGQSRGRSWCDHLQFAPDLRGAFHTGEGRHAFVKPDGRYMDDLYFYDLNAHAWVCIYPGTKNGEDQGLSVGKEKICFVNKAGHPIPVSPHNHMYENCTYDVHRGQFAFWPTSAIMSFWAKPKLKQAAKLIPELQAGMKGKALSPWFWDAAGGKFERKIAKGSTYHMNLHGIFGFIYMPGVRKYLARSRNARYAFLYDSTENSWSKTSEMPKEIVGCGALHCYDSKRDRVLVIGKGLCAYDSKEGKWSGLNGKPDLIVKTNGASPTYDAANDVLVVAVYHSKSKQRGLHIYDCAKDKWLESTPRPFPSSFANRGCTGAFYDPLNNVHYYYRGGDSRAKGTKMVVFRYKSGPAKVADKK